MRQVITAKLVTEYHVWELSENQAHAHFRDAHGNVKTESVCGRFGRGTKLRKRAVACAECYRGVRDQYRPDGVAVG